MTQVALFAGENSEATPQSFIGMGKLAKRLDILRLGTVTVEGTHIKANASKHKILRYDPIVELQAKLEAHQTEPVEPVDGNDKNIKRIGDADHEKATPASTSSDDAQINLTDGDSRVTKKTRYDSYAQAYNNQRAFDTDESDVYVATGSGGHNWRHYDSRPPKKTSKHALKHPIL